MFSGDYPFREIAAGLQVIFAAKQGKRPPRPSHDLCRTRGLDDRMWHLMETCWAGKSSERPTAFQIVEQLRALPSPYINQRSPDKPTNSTCLTESPRCPLIDPIGEQRGDRNFPTVPADKPYGRVGSDKPIASPLLNYIPGLDGPS
jgi:hypothetical protein